ncbi:MAG: DUF1707 domain-containing protein [Kutzneria sp.]|nr:DUF1707 domain-containing protein [Kutzneria sp.]
MSQPESPDIRISDTEREEAIKALGEHMGAGRLDVDEYGDRSARVATARTRSELLALFTDLPAPKPAFGVAATAVQPIPEAPVPATRSGWHGLPGEVTGPIIGVTWIAAIFFGDSLGLHDGVAFGVAIIVSILLGGVTRGHRHRQRRDRRRGSW